MLRIRGYLANHDSELDGGAFLIQHQNPEELLAWLKNETDNSVTVVLISIEEQQQ